MTDTSPPPAERRSSSTPAIVGAVVAIVVLALGIWGLATLGNSSKPGKKAAAPPASASAAPQESAAPAAPPVSAAPAVFDESEPAKPAAACKWNKASGQDLKEVGTPPKGEPRKGTATMTVETTLGTIEIKINLARTPCTAWSFHYLGDKKFFDDTTCHRVTSAGPEATIGILQCGDPTATGGGGPTYQYADENLDAQSDQIYERGLVAMANAGPGTNGSQFFFNFKAGQLNNAYTPFGVVTKGMEIIDAIAAKGNDNSWGDGSGRPVQGFSIVKIRVTTP